ncbi:putative sec23/Sec24, trunk domain, sec23/Sec24, helical domain-containing protein [Helianthus annuus]|uniref:Putative sec23/sec24 transport family protein n=1 Tax=Helianthus annuus TaxID=4232 RepID=A0A251S2Q6_HELAN|nr:protein transport protein Sec24-like At3g07100 isoform X1 [Helianthus annuus]KAF5819682.1 putative sec23/Sec24, trunk domain, sec23/Sec24, helical domain-containing protein [Helianthus annuus]KAJ0616692.1 putative sec23/Sec24, trunk domain, sec23/Sec24, helical domain-containing protein [Helianthus annuus]KAJ0806384.1 putative sec23/Sec24, trunk domain, sec23/Sec24, helical domain-containing protein [Helianthus annuus]KAJ0941175.1 putative sec23/Sec24, trunk domain, sec23/Sec24, helical doma
MAVRATVLRFPSEPDAQESSGLPWGVTVTPFAAKDENGNSPLYGSGGDLIPRCENCWAYYNTYCDQEQWAWTCAICGTLNGLSSETIARHANPESSPETMSSFIDLELPLDGAEEEDMQARPVYVAAIDLASSEEFLELTKSALLAALEALAPGSLFGLATFSHKLGLYDVQGPIPVVKNVFLPADSDGTLSIELEDAMPLFSFLAPVETCKDRIASALETLRPTSSWAGTGGEQGLDRILLGGRGFGLAMESLISYLGSEHGNTFALARIFAFLSGPPDYGPGQLDTRRYGEQYASRGEDAELALLPEQTPFYKDLAAVAVQAGVCIDILAVTNEYTDLASLKFLSIDSGGSLFLYPNTDDSTLPQDMYRMLSRPYAFNCVMRLRTSTEFKTGNSYGHFFPDPQYENVQHVICCDSYATYAYDFDFVNNDGFARHTSELPMLQLAFQYTVVVPPEEHSTTGSGLTSRSKYTIKRRLRIRTMQFGVARNFNELYDSVDPEVVLSILVHKVILASLSEGVREGRMLLHDWLVILTAQYNDVCKIASSEFRSSTGSLIDVTFSQCPQLQALPRLVFALLRNPLLRFHEEGIHPDYRIYLQCLFSGLEPSSLHRAIYPLLTSYANPDKLAYPRHSLSRAALMTSESPIFFLDAFTTLIVFYSSTADPTLPYPPPHDCLLRRTINKVKQERSITPRLMFIRGGQEDASVFESYLIEEQDVDGGGFANAMGFVSFLEEISQSVLEYMK